MFVVEMHLLVIDESYTNRFGNAFAETNALPMLLYICVDTGYDSLSVQLHVRDQVDRVRSLRCYQCVQ